MEGWRSGRRRKWRDERLEEGRSGREKVEEWRVEGWRGGGVEGWRVEGWRGEKKYIT